MVVAETELESAARAADTGVDPAWINRLVLGIVLLLLPNAAMALAVPVLVWQAIPPAVALFLPAFLLIPHAAGAWLLACRPHTQESGDPLRGMGIALRLCASLPVLAGILFTATRVANGEFAAMLANVAAVLLAPLVFCPALEFVLLARLGRQILGRPAPARIAVVGWGYSAATALAALTPLILAWRQWDLSDQALMVVTLAILVMLMLSWIAAGVTLGVAAAAFARGARQAHERLQATAPTLTAPTNGADPVSIDTPCVRCGYNLRGLEPQRQCPECGLSVARSLTLGRELHDSRPAWIASLAWAAKLLLAPQALLVAALFSVVNRERDLFTGALAAGAVLHVLGAWLLTRPENPHARYHPSWELVFLLRAFSIGPVLAAAILCYIESGFWWTGGWWAMPDTLRSGAALLALMYIPCPLIEFVLLRRLAKRVLDESLAEHSMIVACGYCLSLCLLAGLIFWERPNLSENLVFAAILGILAAAMLFWIWAFVLLLVFAVAFHRGAKAARQAWRQADAAA